MVFGLTSTYFKLTKMLPYGWHQVGKFLKIAPPDALKVISLALFVLRFLCNTLLRG